MAVAFNDTGLRSLLEASSSRVFNCNAISRRLLEAKDPEPYFFKTPRMNSLVLIKEAILDERVSRRMRDEIVGTKLYFPYDAHDIYAGGRSIYVHDEKLQRVVTEQLGGTSNEAVDVAHDLNILAILDKLPSLDGFLMRDALEIEGIKCNAKYFDVTVSEHHAIRSFIRKKFDPLVRIAYENESNVASKVTNLIEKMWDANDLEALAPLIRAFRFPEEDALAIFAAWKGLNFYSFQYVQARPAREQFALWLRDSAKPRNFCPGSVTEHLANLRQATVRKLRAHWQQVDEITREYDRVYEGLLSGTEAASIFVTFINGSRKFYWQMGDSLSKISHAVSCWRKVVQGDPCRRLPSDDLDRLFTVINQILFGEESPGVRPHGARTRRGLSDRDARLEQSRLRTSPPRCRRSRAAAGIAARRCRRRCRRAAPPADRAGSSRRT